jgi:Asp-tRNA(Asn)/Glu-tRNA(Gln) amidotransferase A subunit family amidase
MVDAALVTMTIAELAPKIKSKAISPVELTEAVLAQVDRLQPILNSFITILPIVRQKFTGLSQGCPWASPVHISIWSKGS